MQAGAQRGADGTYEMANSGESLIKGYLQRRGWGARNQRGNSRPRRPAGPRGEGHMLSPEPEAGRAGGEAGG